MEKENRNEPEIHIEMLDTEAERMETPPDETVEQPIPEKPAKKRQDPVVIGLMFGVSFLCLCIIGVMLYWLTAFLG